MKKKKILRAELNKKPRIELLILAEKMGLKNYSNKTKEQLVKLLSNGKYPTAKAIGLDVNRERKKAKAFWEGIGKVHKVTAIIVSTSLILSYLIAYFDIHKIIKRDLFNLYDNSFKIVIVPLNPDLDNEVMKPDYEGLIASRYKNIADDLFLDINIDIIEKPDMPLNDQDAQKIGVEEKAALVIWGNYEEDLNGPKKLKIRYNLTQEIGLLTPKTGGDSEFNEVQDLSELRTGNLMNDVDNIVYKSLVIYLFNNGYYGKIKSITDRIKDKACDVEILLIESIALWELNQKKKHIQPMIKAMGCLLEEDKIFDTYKEEIKKEQKNDKTSTLNFEKSLDVYEEHYKTTTAFFHYLFEHGMIQEMEKVKLKKITQTYNNHEALLKIVKKLKDFIAKKATHQDELQK